MDPKTAAPLGSTVADYVAGRAFLYRALPLLLACLLAELAALQPCSLHGLPGCTAWPLLRLLLQACLALTALLLCIGLYGLRTISAWLPTVPEPCYELLHAGSRALLLPPPSLPLQQRQAWEVAATADPAARATLVLRAKYSDRLGNNIFQYVYSRLRAAFLDVAFEAPPLGAPFASVAVRVERAGAGGGGPGGGAAGAPSPPCHAQQLRGGQAASPSWASAAQAWLLEPTCRYSMNTRLLAGFEGQVAGWLQPCLAALPPQPTPWGPRDCAIHVRVGDILWGHHAAYRPLPMSFYWAALKAVAARAPGQAGSSSSSSSRSRGLSLGRVVLVAEGSAAAAQGSGAGSSAPLPSDIVGRMAAALADPALQRAAGVSLGSVQVQQGGSVPADLAALASAPALILSISSFSWWPAFLSTHPGLHTVVLPQWGLTLPHAWRPSPQGCPDYAVQQCLALAALPVQAEAEGGGGQGLPLARREAALRRALVSLGGQQAFASSAVVLEVPLPRLPCWGGKTQQAIDALFTD